MTLDDSLKIQKHQLFFFFFFFFVNWYYLCYFKFIWAIPVDNDKLNMCVSMVSGLTMSLPNFFFYYYFFNTFQVFWFQLCTFAVYKTFSCFYKVYLYDNCQLFLYIQCKSHEFKRHDIKYKQTSNTKINFKRKP